MPSTRIAANSPSGSLNAIKGLKMGDSTPSRKQSRNQPKQESPIKPPSPSKWILPRRCSNALERIAMETDVAGFPMATSHIRLNLQGKDSVQMQAVKDALHVATSPTNVACREEEQRRVLEFCKSCVEQEKAGSLYVCGCPGTGKTLSIAKVKDRLVLWSAEVGLQSPDTLTINCTSLTNTSEIFSKIFEKFHPSKKMTTSTSPLKHLHNCFSKKQHSSAGRMILIIIDEMDYLITKDCAVLHDLFMLTTFPFSRCILIGIANVIDLADRFLCRNSMLFIFPVLCSAT